MTSKLCSDPKCPAARSKHYHEEGDVRLTNVRFEQPIGRDKLRETFERCAREAGTRPEYRTVSQDEYDALKKAGIIR